MKKSTKKLTLHRETVRHLENSSMGRIAGGTGPSLQTSAACELATGCDCETEALGCGLPPSACFGSCSCSR